MAKHKFSAEEEKLLKDNPYTLSVNADMIRFTVAFKRLVLEETAKPGCHFQKF